MNSLTASVLTVLVMTTCHAFVANPSVVKNLHSRADTTRLFLEDHIADLIDRELYRQAHKKEFEKEWMEKNRGAVLHSLGGGGSASDHENMATTFNERAEALREHRKDVKLAANDPQRYCADRCVSTGNCDIFEDFYHLSPEEVLDFCEECVLSEEDGQCDLPDFFYEAGTLHP